MQSGETAGLGIFYPKGYNNMWHVILQILAVIGIVLLVLLALLILTVLAVLFVPIRYRASGEKEADRIEGVAAVSFLVNHLIKTESPWAFITAAAIVYIWLNLMNLARDTRNPGSVTLCQLLTVSGFCFIIDYLTGFRRWSGCSTCFCGLPGFPI